MFGKINVAALFQHQFAQHAQTQITNVVGSLCQVRVFHAGKNVRVLLNRVAPTGGCPDTILDALLGIIDQGTTAQHLCIGNKQGAFFFR